MKNLTIAFCFFLGCFCAYPTETDAELHWIEGEESSDHSMQGHNWYDSVKKNELSGGQWLSHFHGGEMPVARYDLTVQQAGDYEFWLRANPVGASISVRVNGEAWKTVSFDTKEQQINIADDGKPDLRFVAWVKADPVRLKVGGNTIEIRFDSENNRHGGLDCFVLSSTSFLPQGNRRPGEKTGLADSGTWAFEPERDRFDPAALLDLSSLNESPAGKHGYVRRSADGSDFVDGAGKPIRFWAINTTVQNRDDLAAVEEHARFMAKRGVNMVRHHGHLPPGSGSKITDVNQSDIDAAWRLVAGMKKHGIYVTLSPYWASHTKPESSWGLKDAGGDSLTGLLFFDPTLQDAYKQWLRKLLLPKNPHTGIPLAKDPALAIFQIQNEDSLLFWTEQAIKSDQRRELGKRFGAWLSKRYGSVAKAAAAWGGDASADGDDFAAGIAMPHPIWQLTQSTDQPNRNPALNKRVSDQLAFYTEVMYRFNQQIGRFLKDEIGYEGLVNAGNWRTADQAKLLDAERFSQTANDVIGVNRYYGGGSHTNPSEPHRSGYLVSKGDLFDGKSALVRPWDFPLALRQVAGKPMILSESAWVPPLRYQSEGPFLVAAYGSMTGFDIFYWFATGDIGFGPPMGKWQLSTPAQLGMFPAAALMFRRGDIRRGTPVLTEHRSTAELWTRKAPMLPEEAGFDPNRDDRAPASEAEAARQGSITPLAYLAGPVEVSFQDGQNEVAELNQLIQPNSQTVRSITGELQWNYVDGFCTLDADNVQGACGNLRQAGTIKLGAVALRSQNEYATVLAVSLDAKSLSQSKKVLIQVGTTARPHGWKTQPTSDGANRIVDLGSSPWNLENASVEMILQNANLTKAIQLDANGLSIKEFDLKQSQGKARFRLPADAMYVVLK